MFVVIVGAIFLTSGRDVLVLISLFVFMILGWISILSFTSGLGHDFLSIFHRLH